MDLEDVMDKLEGFGTEKMANIYRNRGSGSETFGVSIKDRKTLQKDLKKNQILVEELWNTGIIDA